MLSRVSVDCSGFSEMWQRRVKSFDDKAHLSIINRVNSSFKRFSVCAFKSSPYSEDRSDGREISGSEGPSKDEKNVGKGERSASNDKIVARYRTYFS